MRAVRPAAAVPAERRGNHAAWLGGGLGAAHPAASRPPLTACSTWVLRASCAAAAGGHTSRTVCSGTSPAVWHPAAATCARSSACCSAARPGRWVSRSCCPPRSEPHSSLVVWCSSGLVSLATNSLRCSALWAAARQRGITSWWRQEESLGGSGGGRAARCQRHAATPQGPPAGIYAQRPCAQVHGRRWGARCERRADQREHHEGLCEPRPHDHASDVPERCGFAPMLAGAPS